MGRSSSRRPVIARERPRLLRFAERLTIGRAVAAIAGVAMAFTLAAAVAARVIEPETFGSLGRAAWWALQTVSTVGYGDAVPVTAGGRALGAALMLVGIAFVPALTSIVVAVLIARVQERAGLGRDRQVEIVERLDRLERALAELGDRRAR
jgi:voltage-gated potassium channel